MPFGSRKSALTSVYYSWSQFLFGTDDKIGAEGWINRPSLGKSPGQKPTMDVGVKWQRPLAQPELQTHKWVCGQSKVLKQDSDGHADTLLYLNHWNIFPLLSCKKPRGQSSVSCSQPLCRHHLHCKMAALVCLMPGFSLVVRGLWRCAVRPLSALLLMAATKKLDEDSGPARKRSQRATSPYI